MEVIDAAQQPVPEATRRKRRAPEPERWAAWFDRGWARMNMNTLRIGITVGALIVAGAHVALPQLNIDAVTAFLLLLAVLPWLAPILKSIELPGGFKIVLQDVRAAADKVGPPDERRPGPSGGAAYASPHLSEELQQLEQIGQQDPNLALVALRIAIERRLRRGAQLHDLSPSGRSANFLLEQLRTSEVLPATLTSGISDLIQLGNRAAHGADVSRDAGTYALAIAPALLTALDHWLEPKVMSAEAEMTAAAE